MCIIREVQRNAIFKQTTIIRQCCQHSMHHDSYSMRRMDTMSDTTRCRTKIKVEINKKTIKHVAYTLTALRQ